MAQKSDNILVRFKNRDGYIEHTKSIYYRLITDPAVIDIIDAETGEVLFYVLFYRDECMARVVFI